MRRWIGLLGVLAVVGCGASTKFSKVWTDESYVPASSQKILVLGVVKEEATQRIYEAAVVEQLKKRGANADVGFKYIPNEQELDRDLIKGVILDQKFDLVLVTRLISVDTKTQYVPGTTSYAPSYYNPYYGGFYPYYYRSYSVVHTPGYTRQYDVVSLESNVYETAGEKLVWSGVSQTFDPETADEVIYQVSGKLAGELEASGLLYRQK